MMQMLLACRTKKRGVGNQDKEKGGRGTNKQDPEVGREGLEEQWGRVVKEDVSSLDNLVKKKQDSRY